MFPFKKKITPQNHTKILRQSHEFGWDHTLVNTAFMQLRYRSGEVNIYVGHGDYRYNDRGVVSVFQSVCPDNRSLGYVKVIDHPGGSYNMDFCDAAEVKEVIIKYEEPYAARDYIMEIFGVDIKRF